MKTRKLSENGMLNVPVSVRVRSPEEANLVKRVRELVIDRAERVSLFNDMLDLVDEGKSDVVYEAEGDLLARVVVLEMKLNSIQSILEHLTQHNIKQPYTEEDNDSIKRGFKLFRAGNGTTNRLTQEEKSLMNHLFDRDMTNSQISRLSGMSIQGVGRQRKLWNKKPEGQKVNTYTYSKNDKKRDSSNMLHNEPGRKSNTSDINDEGRDVLETDIGYSLSTPIEEIQPKESNVPVEIKDSLVTHGEKFPSQMDGGSGASGSTRLGTNSSSVEERPATYSLLKKERCNEEKFSGKQDNTKNDPREPSVGLHSLKRTAIANMLIDRKFRSAFTLEEIGSTFGITGDAVKRNYLSKLKKAGLLESDREILHEEVLEVFKPNYRNDKLPRKSI